ncbi:MAG: hypothetical protein PHD39_13360, partial [Methylobacter tundripaludum]|nr:hypothetical protein [Methylobacter tundripaludum]
MNLLDALRGFLSNPDNRDIIRLLSGGTVFLVSAIWTLFKRPLWWEALSYLSALKSEPELSDSARLCRIFQTKQAGRIVSLFDVLKGYIHKKRQVLICGAPESGKTVTLKALAYCLAWQAFWFRITLWCVIPLVILLLASFLSWWLGLMLFGVPLINLLLSSYFPLPIFV